MKIVILISGFVFLSTLLYANVTAQVSGQVPLVPTGFGTIVYFTGTMYVVSDSQNIIIATSSTSDNIIKTALDRGGEIYISGGNYNLSKTFLGFDIKSGTHLKLAQDAVIIVPSGYKGHVFRLGNGVNNSVLEGGTITEALPLKRSWVGILMQGGTNGVYFNLVQNLFLANPYIGIDFNGTTGQWVNANTFVNIKGYNYVRGIEFDFKGNQGSTLGFNHNIFRDSLFESGNMTTFGVKDIEHDSNAFYNVQVWDLPVGAKSATIDTSASNTIIIGGLMTHYNFVDNGTNTIILDSSHNTIPSNSVIGTVYNDTNGNGVKDIGELGTAGVKITLYSYVIRQNIGTASADSNGNYIIQNVPLGGIAVLETIPAGTTNTQPGGSIPSAYYGSVSPGQPPTFNFGNKPISTLTAVSGTVYDDNNSNGVKDSLDTSTAGVKITLYSYTTKQIVGTLLTNSTGQYRFDNVPSGGIAVFETIPAGTTNTQPGGSIPGAYYSLVSSGQTVTFNFGNHPLFGPTISMQDTTVTDGYGTYSARPVNAQYVSPSSILVGKNIDTMILHLKKTGVPTGDAAVGVFNPDLSVKKLFATLVVSSLTPSYTDYAFSIPSGQTYSIQAGDILGILYSGGNSSNFVQVTADRNNGFDGTNSYYTFFTTLLGTSTTSDLTMTLELINNPVPTTTGIVLGRIYNDTNGNGLSDIGEPGTGGVKITLYSYTTKQIVDTMTTNSTGQYKFDNVPSGGIAVFETIPAGTTNTQPGGSIPGAYYSLVSSGQTVTFNFGNR